MYVNLVKVGQSTQNDSQLWPTLNGTLSIGSRVDGTETTDFGFIGCFIYNRSLLINDFYKVQAYALKLFS